MMSRTLAHTRRIATIERTNTMYQFTGFTGIRVSVAVKDRYTFANPERFVCAFVDGHRVFYRWADEFRYADVMAAARRSVSYWSAKEHREYWAERELNRDEYED